MVYRDRAATITRALAERYSRHPALAMWHMSNEYGPVAYTCFNHSGTEAAIVPVAPGGTELITGSRVTSPLTLAPLAVAVICYRR